MCVQYGDEEENVVYPAIQSVSVTTALEGIACSDVTAEDTIILCYVIITEDGDYSVTVRVTNSVGSSQSVPYMFDCEFN